MVDIVRGFKLDEARRGTDIFGRPLPETHSGMMELRKQQSAQQLQDAELRAKNRPTRTVVQVPHQGGGTISAIQIFDPITGETTYEPFGSENLLGGMLKDNSGQNQIAGVMRREPGQGPTLNDRLKDAGYVIKLPKANLTHKKTTYADGSQGIEVSGTDENGNQVYQLYDFNNRLIYDSSRMNGASPPATQPPATQTPDTPPSSTQPQTGAQRNGTNPFQAAPTEKEKTTKIQEAEEAAKLLGLTGEEANEFVANQLVGETQTPQDKIDFNLETLEIVLDMLDTTGDGEGLNSAVGPIAGRYIPTIQGHTSNFELAHDQLKSRLSKDNFGIMKGVLSDNDIKLLLNIGTGRLSLVGTEENYIQQLETIKEKLIKGLTKQKIKIPTRPNAVYHGSGDQKSQEVTTSSGKSYGVQAVPTKGVE